jgi:hypothetical protein
MDHDTLKGFVKAQIKLCEDVLIVKGKEYGATDRLHNFRVAAELQGIEPRNALAGMMAKHTVSIYDMCCSDAYFTQAQWDEKITDHINYLLLLSAMVKEGQWTEYEYTPVEDESIGVLSEANHASEYKAHMVAQRDRKKHAEYERREVDLDA